jgi:hypothetical protein
MIKHRAIQSEARTYYIFSAISIFLFPIIIALILTAIKANTEFWNESIPIKQAIQGNATLKTDNFHDSTPVYIDITRVPIKLSYTERHGKTTHYYYLVKSGSETYFFRGNISADNRIAKKLKYGPVTIKGELEAASPRLSDIGYRTYLSEYPDEYMTREEFDGMTGNVVFCDVGDISYSAVRWSIPAWFLFAIAFGGLFSIPSTVNYLRQQSSYSDEFKEFIVRELDDPRTMYIKRLKLYLTPDYLVSVGEKLVIVPYQDIMWAYKKRTYGRTTFWYIKLHFRNFKEAKVGSVSSWGLVKDNEILEKTMVELQRRNPLLVIGKTPELEKQFAQAKVSYYSTR